MWTITIKVDQEKRKIQISKATESAQIQAILGLLELVMNCNVTLPMLPMLYNPM